MEKSRSLANSIIANGNWPATSSILQFTSTADLKSRFLFQEQHIEMIKTVIGPFPSSKLEIV